MPKKKSDRMNNFLLGTLIVLVSISVYNINAVTKGVTHDYMKGLILVFVISLALASLFITILGKARKS
ncbi:MAG: hypothetical protein HYZ16_01470 [Bacteroidetes bacterium]|jgi:hypothetical protein|nr:hypothetical protein [Bacteroidota bacterium]